MIPAKMSAVTSCTQILGLKLILFGRDTASSLDDAQSTGWIISEE
jgi:hypothetical protein